MSEQIDNLVTDFRKALTDVGTSLDDIAADEQRMAAQITALVQQIADIRAAGGTLSDVDFEKLTVFRNDFNAMATRTKAIADAQPDPVPAPAA